jgi:DNA-binding NtrC family response regulator
MGERDRVASVHLLDMGGKWGARGRWRVSRARAIDCPVSLTYPVHVTDSTGLEGARPGTSAPADPGPSGEAKREAALTLEQEFCYQLLDLGTHDAPQPFVEAALQMLITLSGARRGIVQLTDAGEGEPAAAIAVASGIDERLDHGFSNSVIAESLATGETILTSALVDPRFQDRGSVRAHALDAVLCVPIGRSPILGVVYLQDRVEGGMFAQNDVRRVEAFARHTAPLAERLLMRLRREQAQDATIAVRKQLRADNLIGQSKALAAILSRAALAAQVDANVLLTGPTGSGKTALARIIHSNGARARGRFVEINCGTLKPELIANELFGSAAGSHSTANRDREGKVHAAKGGTLFLDEIGDLPTDAQVSLLNLLSERTYYQVGGTELRKADVRVIAATNQDLEAAVAERRFREDLFYRLNVFAIDMPSLNERRSDLVPLANHFCESASSRNNLPPLQLTAGALALIENADWPGNVRELENRIEAAVITAFGEGSDKVERRHLTHLLDVAAADEVETYNASMRRFQRELVLQALDKHKWNVKATAVSLDIARAHLYNLMSTLGIKRPTLQR